MNDNNAQRDQKKKSMGRVRTFGSYNYRRRHVRRRCRKGKVAAVLFLDMEGAFPNSNAVPEQLVTTSRNETSWANNRLRQKYDC
jgi:hypothetical protein